MVAGNAFRKKDGKEGLAARIGRQPRRDGGHGWIDEGLKRIKIEKKKSGTLCWLQIKDQTNRSTSLRDASNFFPVHLFFPLLFLLSLIFLSFFLLYLRLPKAFLLRILSLSLFTFGSESTFQSFFFCPTEMLAGVWFGTDQKF